MLSARSGRSAQLPRLAATRRAVSAAGALVASFVEEGEPDRGIDVRPRCRERYVVRAKTTGAGRRYGRLRVVPTISTQTCMLFVTLHLLPPYATLLIY
jgi:hypothetical protein